MQKRSAKQSVEKKNNQNIGMRGEPAHGIGGRKSQR